MSHSWDGNPVEDGPDDIHDSDADWRDLPGVDANEERVYHFKNMGLLPSTLMLFHKNGFTMWTSTRGGGILQTTRETWDRIGVPDAEQEKLEHRFSAYMRGHEHYNDGAATLPPPTGIDAADPLGQLGQLGLVFASLFGMRQRGRPAASSSDGRFPTLMIYLCIAIAFLLLGAAVGRADVVAVALTVGSLFSAPLVMWMGVGGGAATRATLGCVISNIRGTLAECVDGETRILNAEREEVPIRELAAGEYVLGWSNRKYVVCRIVDKTVQVASGADLYEIAFGESGKVVATSNHPFWVDEKKWCSVDPQGDGASMKTRKLAVGDCCRDADGRKVQVKAITSLASSGSREVFNLIVGGPGTWFANCILSHSAMRAKTENKENLGLNKA